MSNITSDIPPQGGFAKLNDNQLIKFGGGGLAVLLFLSSIVAGIFTTIDPKYLVGAGFVAFVLMLFIWANHVWHSQRTEAGNIGDDLQFAPYSDIGKEALPLPPTEKAPAAPDAEKIVQPLIWELRFERESTRYVQRLGSDGDDPGTPERYYIGVYNPSPDTSIQRVRVEVDVEGREGIRYHAIRLREKYDQEPFSFEYTINPESELFFLLGEVDGSRRFSVRGEDQHAFPPHNVTVDIAVSGENVPKIRGRLPLWWRHHGLDMSSGRLSKK